MMLLTSLRALAMPPRRVQVEAHAVLERVGIADKLFERVDRLSGGERQRVAIARALYQGPDVLLACVREATVLGMLGISSLAFWIQDARARNFYDEMFFSIVLGGTLVVLGDFVSAAVRHWIRNN